MTRNARPRPAPRRPVGPLALPVVVSRVDSPAHRTIWQARATFGPADHIGVDGPPPPGRRASPTRRAAPGPRRPGAPAPGGRPLPACNGRSC